MRDTRQTQERMTKTKTNTGIPAKSPQSGFKLAQLLESYLRCVSITWFFQVLFERCGSPALRPVFLFGPGCAGLRRGQKVLGTPGAALPPAG